MSRVLSVARASVPKDAEPAYLDLARRLSASIVAGGGHCWVFRHRTEPGIFLECVEGPGPADPLTGPAAALRREMKALARYRSDEHDLWDEIA